MNEEMRTVKEKVTAAIQESLQEYIGCKSTQTKREQIIQALQATLDRSYGVGYATVESMEVDGTTTVLFHSLPVLEIGTTSSDALASQAPTPGSSVS